MGFVCTKIIIHVKVVFQLIKIIIIGFPRWKTGILVENVKQFIYITKKGSFDYFDFGK